MSSCGCAGSCEEKKTFIFPCSGAADVGELSDKVARRLSRDGVGKMFCLAGIGGGVSGIIETTKSAARILAIDGCQLDCVKKTLEKNGFKFVHARLTDLGFAKGATPSTEENLGAAAQKCKAMVC